MPSSSASDQLAKSLHPFLASAVAYPQLKALGWFDFLTSDRPETNDPVEMAAAAFAYLSIEEDGSWNGHKGVLTGIIACLRSRLKKTPSHGDLLDLKSMLENPPVPEQGIHGWFARVYR